MNTGQLKHIAKQAMAELDARLPGRAGIAIHRMVDAWPAQTYDRDDFAAVNVGQVKALAKLFYDRLHQAGYLLPYPWNPSSSVQDDFAAANVGQVKAVFSFSVDGPIFEDADDDGLSDDWEFENFGSRSATNGAGDEDNDGVTNAVEFHYGTSPWSSDTDDDGLSDAAEIFTHHTDPTNGDTDADNLTDGSEVITYASLGLSPLNARSKAADVTDAAWLSVYDADGDGLPMLTEQSIPGLSDANPADAWGDMDHDGFSNLYEFRWGMNMQVAESSADGDGDGMSDVFEERFHQNKNNRYDAFLDSDGDGLLNYEEALHAMDPLNAHTRGGPQTDYQIVLAETAAANGTASEGGAAGAAESPGAATSGAGAGSAAIDDYDGDGLPNWWEILYGTNPRLADADADPDDDGLLNRFEYQLLANPLDHDTDDDGTSDGEDPTPGSLIFPLGDKSYRLGVYVTDSYVAHLAARGILCDRFDVNTGDKGGMHFDASGFSELGVLPELTMGGHIKPWRDLIPYGNSISLGAVNDLISLGNARMSAAAQHYGMTAWSFAKDGTVGWTGFTIPNGPAYSACGNQIWGPSYDRSDLRYYYVSEEAAKEAGKVFLRKQTYRYDASKCLQVLTAQERQPVSDEVIAVTVGTSIWNPAVVSHEQTPFANDAAFQAARGKTTTIRVKPLQPDLDWVRPDASEVDEREEYSPGYVTINPPDLTALPALKIRASGDDAGTAWYKLQATYPALVTFDQPVDGIDAATDRLVHFTLNTAPGALVPPFLSFKLLYSGDGTNYQEVDEVGMSLLPVEVMGPDETPPGRGWESVDGTDPLPLGDSDAPPSGSTPPTTTPIGPDQKGDLKPLTEFKIAKMTNTVDGDNKLQIGRDPDRFLLRIPGLSNAGDVRIKIATEGATVNEHDDNATELRLTADFSGNYTTDWQVLVSNKVLAPSLVASPGHPVLPRPADAKSDDDYTGDYKIGEDDQPPAQTDNGWINDCTHIAELGSKVVLKGMKIGDKPWQDMNVTLLQPLAVKKEIPVRFAVMSDTTTPDVQGDLKRANERWAQVGIKFRYEGPTLTIKPQDVSVPTSNGGHKTLSSSVIAAIDDNGSGGLRLGVEAIAIIDTYNAKAATPVGPNDILMIYCKDVFTPGEKVAKGQDVAALATFPSWVAKPENGGPNRFRGAGSNPQFPAYAKKVFVSQLLQKPHTVPHELGHLLLDQGHFNEDYKPWPTPTDAEINRLDSHNLMRFGTSPHDGVGETKRLYELQEDMLKATGALP
ncbi:MAG: hypothetical protein K1X78_24225 [Verrucomicrobiaceae bacterium]|nr:hypothetical protein [Verrucomicrobiaceae bacterium]